MVTTDGWLTKSPDAEMVVCTPADVYRLNKTIREQLPDYVFDLSQYPIYIPADTIACQIRENEFPAEPHYCNGSVISADFLKHLSVCINLQELQGIVQIKYGFTLRRTNLRTFPTNDFVTASTNDREFDQFQETVLNPAEPVVVLHHSADRNWLFIQATNYRGWVESDSLAISKDRNLWLNYSQASAFLVVTGNRLMLSEEPYLPYFSGLVFAMGAKLPLLEEQYIPDLVGNRCPNGCHVVLLPVRDQDGQLDFQPALVAKSADVRQGYLPFSRANLIRQAFKLQGDRYGWGGLFGSRDCSSLIQDVFRSVGVQLPRNATEQARASCTQISLINKTHSERREILQSLPPGSILHFPGHIMLYLGERRQEFYVIHAIAACGDPNRPQPDGTLARQPLNGVMVTSLSLPRVNGKTLFESLTEAVVIP